jgi:hypothetical protein
MTDAPVAKRPCVICDTDRRTVIETLLAAGRTANFIEGQMRKLGTPTKSETILKHQRVCLAGRRPSQSLITDAAVGRTDFAGAVRDEAMRMLDRGELKIRTNDGLWAQGLLDKREEKKADRDLLLNLARLMSGTAPPPEVIVGHWEEVGNDDPEPKQLSG